MKNPLEALTQKFKPIMVYALVGESGTGKSFRSKLLCEEYGIETIIDDGLLIQNDKILAGHSAKQEKTYMGAVRAALFDDKEHRDSVAKVMKKIHIKKLLILGTSEKMVTKIAIRLQLPQPSKIINIHEIATEEEIAKALKSRQIEGKHVIPVPSIEVKKSYPQIFSNSLHDFFTKRNIFTKHKKGTSGKMIEKSIVQPEFSKKGRIEISEAALTQMVMHCVEEIAPDVKIKKISIKTDSRGYRLIVTIDVPFGTQLTGKVHKIQQYIIEKIESFTGILIEEVSIVIDKITKTDVPQKEEKNSSKLEELKHTLARTHIDSKKK